MKKQSKQHVFIVGAKSLGMYGGYETFVYKLTEYHQDNPRIMYHVACKANGDGYMNEEKIAGVKHINSNVFELHNARCFKIKVPNIGPAVAIYYDVVALRTCCNYIKKHNIENPIIYVLACRIGPFAKHFQEKIHKLGGRLYLNPDGHEWMRAKWSKPIQKYWKMSEKQMVKYSDLVICDSKNIEKYIHKVYDKKGCRCTNPQTTYIAYGAETKDLDSVSADDKYINWLKNQKIDSDYYLICGRFVPENNYETMISEFMKSKTDKKLVIVTNQNDGYFDALEKQLHFKNDDRIRFVGTIYDQELLKIVREKAYGYLHGHEVGGTNPSLLEALGSTKLNLLLNVGFNREVAEDSALYWNKTCGNLTKLLEQCDQMSTAAIDELGIKAKKRIADAYSWKFISDEYERVFVQKNNCYKLEG